MVLEASSSSDSSSSSSTTSSSTSTGAAVDVEVALPTAKAEVKVGAGAGAGAQANAGANANAGGSSKFSAGASLNARVGLNWSGAGNICVSVGKIASIAALAFMFVVEFAVICSWGGCGIVGYGITFWLMSGWFCALLVMDLIGKPACILKWFPFIHYPIGVMATLLILSFFVFPFCGMGGNWQNVLSGISGILTWLVFLYLLIIALLLGFGVI